MNELLMMLSPKTKAKLREWQYRGDAVHCPCCGGDFRAFLPYGLIPRPNADCPRCQSKERHRLLMLYLKNETALFDGNIRLLHIAPEKVLRRHFEKIPNIHYISGDMNPAQASLQLDVTDNLFRDDCFDVIICNHVLEHVPDDGRAMREFFRVLKPGGWAILMVPVDESKTTTFEDPSVTDPKERERLFGQHDHVRVYGTDYESRLEQAGFSVLTNDYARELGEEQTRRFGLQNAGKIYRTEKRK